MNQNVTSFASPADPNLRVWLNLDSVKTHILCQPEKTELLQFLQGFETRIINAFWDKAVLTESPYTAGVPYGLSCSVGGHTVVPTHQVAGMLGIQGGVNQRILKTVHAAGFNAMVSALEQLRPKTIASALQNFTENGRLRFQTFSVVDRLSQCGSFANFVESVTSTALSKSPQKRFAFGCLIAMCANGWLLLPTNVVQKVGHFEKGLKMTGNDWAPFPMEYLNPNQLALLRELEGAGPYRPGAEGQNAQVKARFAVLCSSLNSVRDINWKFSERILFSTGKQDRSGANATSTSKIRAHWRQLCQSNGQPAMVGTFRQDYRECIKLRCPADPRLNGWLDILAKECETQTSGNFEPRYQGYGYWLTWLSSLQVIPSPVQVVRSHINDIHNPQANTFRRFLEQSPIEKAKTRNSYLMKMADFFDGLVSAEALKKRLFHNPIQRKVDAFKNPRREVQQGTKRKRLPGWVLDDLKKMIVREDPDTPGKFYWAESLKNIAVLWIQVANRAEKVFCPILAAIIYLMLDYPLRSHQVRWLDSGELDAIKYDFELKEFVKNLFWDGEHQSYGLLKPPSGSPLESELPIDFQVAVNKVLLGERKESSFTIPYITPQTLWVIREVLKWQAEYGVPPKRVKEVYEPTKLKNRNQSQEDFYPDICALFRYPLQKSYFPPSLQQLTYFWGCFCAQWDRMNENWKDPSTGDIIKRPRVPILSKRYREHWDVATHDLHSLRVAGVSFLLDAGIPLAVVASIAGHRSIAMTLHYYRADLGELRLKLKDAYAKMGDKSAWDHLHKRLHQDYQSYESWLKATPDGFQALREARKTNIWSISLSGICPGTSCDDGLPSEFARPCGTDVPGSRCGLCRFFVSGPPFLPGLVHEFNCLLFDLEQKAHRQMQLRADIDAAEDHGHQGQLEILRGENQRLENECHLDLKVLARLHILINECLDIVNKNEITPAVDGPLSLVCAQPGEMRTKLEYVGPFKRLKDLVDAAAWLPISRQTAPDQALLQLKDKILYCLRTNGASCFLAGLPSELSKRMTVQLADIIEKFIPDEDQRERLISGQLLLKQMPTVQEPLIQTGTVYADHRGNAVFLLLGSRNDAVGAELRGTTDRSWRGMAPGSRKDVGFFSVPAARHLIEHLVRNPGAFVHHHVHRLEYFPDASFRLAYDRLVSDYGLRAGQLEYLRLLELAAELGESAISSLVSECSGPGQAGRWRVADLRRYLAV